MRIWLGVFLLVLLGRFLIVCWGRLGWIVVVFIWLMLWSILNLCCRVSGVFISVWMLVRCCIVVGGCSVKLNRFSCVWLLLWGWWCCWVWWGRWVRWLICVGGWFLVYCWCCWYGIWFICCVCLIVLLLRLRWWILFVILNLLLLCLLKLFSCVCDRVVCFDWGFRCFWGWCWFVRICWLGCCCVDISNCWFVVSVG